MMVNVHQKKAYIALGITCLIWGTTYLVNKVGVSHVSPILFSAVRQLIAGGLMLAYCFLIKKFPFPDKEYLYFQFILGIVLIGIGNGVGIIGLSFIDSGLSAILAALSPIVIAILNLFILPSAKLNKIAWVGVLTGFFGLLLICFDKVKLENLFTVGTGLGVSLTLISVIAWGAGSVYSKTKSFAQSTMIAAGFQMLFGSLPMIIMLLLDEKSRSQSFDGTALWALLYVITFGSIIAYSFFIYALSHLPAIITGIQSYVSPVIAIILGFLILDEPLNGYMILGSALVLSGVFLVNYAELIRDKFRSST
ncbi:MAG: EamA family transporter [Saprospiraceae bacterium]|nr:EamA family transporter [Saprospiraceae bacterium]MBK9632554.1 EamA family transporter [Saprospiraceae bacterium]